MPLNFSLACLHSNQSAVASVDTLQSLKFFFILAASPFTLSFESIFFFVFNICLLLLSFTTLIPPFLIVAKKQMEIFCFCHVWQNTTEIFWKTIRLYFFTKQLRGNNFRVSIKGIRKLPLTQLIGPFFFSLNRISNKL